MKLGNGFFNENIMDNQNESSQNPQAQYQTAVQNHLAQEGKGKLQPSPDLLIYTFKSEDEANSFRAKWSNKLGWTMPIISQPVRCGGQFRRRNLVHMALRMPLQ